MIKSDILFTGYYGQQNTGDDAFVEVAAWGANKYWNKSNLRFLGKKSKMPVIITSYKGYPFELKRTYSLQAKALLNNCDSFIYAGGSTIYDKLQNKNIRLKAVKKKENGAKFKFGAIGVSIGPFKTKKDEKAVESYLRQMDFLALRDQASYEIVSNIKNLPYEPVNAFDLAALLPRIYTFKKSFVENNKKTIGISVCRYESLQDGMSITKEEERNSMLVKLIKKLDENENLHFKFFVINGNSRIGDLTLTKETILKANPKSYEIYHYNKEVRSTWHEIAKCDFVISTRLHAAIFACFAQVPFMLNEYHRKCGDFLEDIGYNENYKLYNSEYVIEDKANLILEIINNPSLYVSPKYIEEMVNKSLLNFTSIKI